MVKPSPTVAALLDGSDILTNTVYKPRIAYIIITAVEVL